MKPQRRQTDQNWELPPDSAARAVAVIGMAGRFPGAGSAEALWESLMQGMETVADAPPDRTWAWQLADSPGVRGKTATRRGGFLSNVSAFDAAHFDVSPREAHRMDPQVRLLLETAHETLEDSGLPTDSLSKRSVGVFIGAAYGDYWLRQIWDLEDLDFYTEMGTSRASLSGKISYAFDWRGPSLTVDTACSSSLATVRLACQSLLAGDCEAALAGGSNLVLAPYNSVTFNQAGAHSADGSCKFGDASADGYVRSEAVGLVMLKPLTRALVDGDRVRGVILGGSITSNGFTGGGTVAPSAAGQQETLAAAYRDANVDPAEVCFVEAHGTGTTAGDAAELSALAAVLGPRPGRKRCVISSVKANIGHAEGAAGVVGLIKAILCLEHRVVPPAIHIQEPNPVIDWATAPLVLPDRVAALPGEGPLLAGVTSFGASGTNVHLVLRSAPAADESVRGAPRPVLLALSANDETALGELARSYRRVLTETHDAMETRLASICAGAAINRRHSTARLAVVADSPDGAVAGLDSYLEGRLGPSTWCSASLGIERPRVVFVFPGQGSQWAAMGRDLLGQCAPFRAALEVADKVLIDRIGWSAVGAIEEQDDSWLGHTRLVQPALWAMGVALARTWQHWGVDPDAVLGQSQGEIAAAHIAGALTLEQSGELICARADLATRMCPPGAMGRIELSADEVRELIRDSGTNAHIAVLNSPTSTVLSGSPDDFDRIDQVCLQRGIDCQRIPVDYAAHSHMVDRVREPLLDALADLAPAAGTVPMYSTVTGQPVPGTELDCRYWWQNLREPVRLSPTVQNIARSGPVVFVQMSPHPLLTTAIEESVQAIGGRAVALPSLRRGQPDRAVMLGSLAALYTSGTAIDWEEVYSGTTRSFDLPRYPLRPERFWHQAPSCPWPPLDSEPHLALQQVDPTIRPITLDSNREAFLRGHQVAGRAVMPGAGFVEHMLSATGGLQSGHPVRLRDIEFLAMLPLTAERLEDIDLRVTVSDQHGTRQACVESRSPDGRWVTHARAELAVETTGRTMRAATLAEARRRCSARQSGDDFYRQHEQGNNEWRGAFRGIVELWQGTGEVVARVQARDASGYSFHPAVLDACLQTMFAVGAFPRPGTQTSAVVLTGIDHLEILRPGLSMELWCHTRDSAGDSDEIRADISVFDSAGELVAEIAGVRGAALTTPPSSRDHLRSSAYSELRWRRLIPDENGPGHGTFALLCGSTAFDMRLTEQLIAGGGSVLALSAAAGPDAVAEALSALHDDVPLRALICLAAPSADPADNPVSAEMQSAAVDLMTTLLHAIAATQRFSTPPPIVVVTRGAVSTAEEDACPALWQAPLWGFAPVAGREHRRRTLLVDLDSAATASDEDATVLARVLSAPITEDRMALRAGHWLVPRLVTTAPLTSPHSDETTDAQVLIPSGGLDGFQLETIPRRAPGPGQVEVAVSHIGLNFHDLLTALEAFPAESCSEGALFGAECAGTVTRIGIGVTGLAPGDSVLAYAEEGMRSHVVADARLVVRKPENLSPACAAAVSVAMVTAYYALVVRAGLCAGERVLIHSASGGLGLAAMAVAKWRKATIFATAGSPSKRDLLRQLGAAKVADSRSASFADDFAEESPAVDVVLNTLTDSAAIAANYSLLAPFGRYIDVTVRTDDDKSPPPVVLSDSRSYFHVQLHELSVHAPDKLGELLRTVTDLIGSGELPPIVHRVFPVEEAATAFGLMRRAEHIGKLVLEFSSGVTEPARPSAPAASKPVIRADATYLVTGGLRGVGGLCSRWLIDRGARNLLVVGQTQLEPPPTPTDERAELLRELRARGAVVHYAAVDVADESAMAELLNEIGGLKMPPIAGVVHSAAVLAPNNAADLSSSDIEATLRPKVAGGWTLHRLFGDELDFLVLFSSAAGLLAGTSATHQLSAYAAANAFLHTLADWRRQRGLPATVVDWGYWSKVGLAARLSAETGHRVRPTGMMPIEPSDGPALFDDMVARSGRMIYLPADWAAYLDAYPQDAEIGLLRELRPTDPTTRPSAAVIPSQPLDTELRERELPEPARPEATPTEPELTDRALSEPILAEPRPASPATASQNINELVVYLADQVAEVLGLPPEQLDPDRPTNRLGMDSLMAADVRSRLRRDRGHEVTVGSLLNASSLRQLARELITSQAPRHGGNL